MSVPHLTRYIHLRLVCCWPSVADAGPTTNQPRVTCLVFVSRPDATAARSGNLYKTTALQNIVDFSLNAVDDAKWMNGSRAAKLCVSAHGVNRYPCQLGQMLENGCGLSHVKTDQVVCFSGY